MEDRPMEAKLNKAVELRIKREGDFIDEIISQINLAIESLDEYDPSNARTAIDLTKEQLSDIIFKLNDVSNMTERTASIANIVKDKNLMRRPQTQVQTPPQTQVQTPPPAALPTQPQTPGLYGRRPAPLPSTPPPLPLVPQSHPLVKPRIGGRKTRRRRKTRR